MERVMTLVMRPGFQTRLPTRQVTLDKSSPLELNSFGKVRSLEY